MESILKSRREGFGEEIFTASGRLGEGPIAGWQNQPEKIQFPVGCSTEEE
jgi:hypothetical protein